MDLKLHEKTELEKNLDLLWFSACELTFRLVEWGLVVALLRFLWKVTEKDIFYNSSVFLMFLMFMYISSYIKHKVNIEIFKRPVDENWKWWLEFLIVLLVSLGMLIVILAGVAALVNAVTEAYPNL